MVGEKNVENNPTNLLKTKQTERRHAALFLFLVLAGFGVAWHGSIGRQIPSGRTTDRKLLLAWLTCIVSYRIGWIALYYLW